MLKYDVTEDPLALILYRRLGITQDKGQSFMLINVRLLLHYIVITKCLSKLPIAGILFAGQIAESLECSEVFP